MLRINTKNNLENVLCRNSCRTCTITLKMATMIQSLENNISTQIVQYFSKNDLKCET